MKSISKEIELRICKKCGEEIDISHCDSCGSYRFKYINLIENRKGSYWNPFKTTEYKGVNEHSQEWLDAGGMNDIIRFRKNVNIVFGSLFIATVLTAIVALRNPATPSLPLIVVTCLLSASCYIYAVLLK